MRSTCLLLVAAFCCGAGSWLQVEATRSRSCPCPRIYRPVCGADGETYGNSCEADCESVTYTAGACADSVAPGQLPAQNRPGHHQRPAQRPAEVTAAKRQHVAQLPANVKGAGLRPAQLPVFPDDVLPPGEPAQLPAHHQPGHHHHQHRPAQLPAHVPAQLPAKRESPPCACPMNYWPVCGSDGVTYGNDCQATCNGVEFTYGGCADK